VLQIKSVGFTQTQTVRASLGRIGTVLYCTVSEDDFLSISRVLSKKRGAAAAATATAAITATAVTPNSPTVPIRLD